MQPFLHRIFKSIFRLTAFSSILMLIGVVIAAYQEVEEEVTVSLIAATVGSITSMFFSRKISWFFSVEGRRYRHLRKFKENTEQIKKKGQQKRSQMSQKSDLKNMHELRIITKKELLYRKSDIAPNVLSQIKSTLVKYEGEINIEKMMEIYNTVTQADSRSINEKLKQLLV